MDRIYKIISIIANIHNNANKLIVDELKKHNLEGLAPSHGDILALLYQNEEGVPMNKISKSLANQLYQKLYMAVKLGKKGKVKALKDLEKLHKGIDKLENDINDVSHKFNSIKESEDVNEHFYGKKGPAIRKLKQVWAKAGIDWNAQMDVMEIQLVVPQGSKLWVVAFDKNDAVYYYGEALDNMPQYEDEHLINVLGHLQGIL